MSLLRRGQFDHNDDDDEEFKAIWQDSQLSYVGKDCLKIPIFLSNSYGKVAKRLDLSYNQLTTLSGLENFIALEELILDNNSLADGLFFPSNFHLKTLSLNKNKFQNLDSLLERIKSSCPNLTYLSLLGNPACPDQLSSMDKDDSDYQRYRYYVIHKMPGLLFLDSTKVKLEDRKEAKRVGGLMKVIRPVMDQIAIGGNEDDDDGEFSPLPSTDNLSPHRGAYGKLKYKYTGKHSEGNRFIRNHEL